MNKDLPVIVFHDWGNGMPFLSEINDQDRILWLKVYTPEVFASGAVFAWPVSGGGVNYRPSVAIKDTISKLSGWYGRNRNLYLNSSWNARQTINPKGQLKLVHTILDQYSPSGNTLKKVVHLINKNLDAGRKLVGRTNFNIKVFSKKIPRSVWAVSPDFQDAKPLNFVISKDSVEVTVNRLDAYTVVVLDYALRVPQTIHFNSLLSHQTGDLDFDPGAFSSSGLTVSYSSDNPGIATIVNGKISIVGKGTCKITASQAGNSQYEPAPEVFQSFAVTVVSVEDVKKDEFFKIYPNPCNSVLYIEKTIVEPVHVQIISLSGQKLLDKVLDGNELDISFLSQGLYLIKIEDFITSLIKN